MAGLELRGIEIGDTVTITFNSDTAPLTGVYQGFQVNYRYLKITETTNEHFVPTDVFSYITKGP
jgi:hypothetical protein